MASADTAFGLNATSVDIAPMLAKLKAEQGLEGVEAREAAGQAYLDCLDEKYGPGYALTVQIAPDGTTLTALQRRTVVEQITDEKTEITLDEMRKSRPDIQAGEEVYRKLPLVAFDDFPLGTSAVKIANVQITEI